ncbi:MAG: hypothetical protein JSW47_23475, partial [Phycisphaerales bacterium]
TQVVARQVRKNPTWAAVHQSAARKNVLSVAVHPSAARTNAVLRAAVRPDPFRRRMTESVVAGQGVLLRNRWVLLHEIAGKSRKKIEDARTGR